VAEDFIREIKLAAKFPTKIVVADSFYVLPLIRALQSADRYQVLCLSRTNVTLYEGNRYQLDEITSPEVPSNLEAALGSERTEPRMTVASYTGAAGPKMHHSHGDKSSEDEKDIVRFFRDVDRAVLNEHSLPSGLPLIVVTLPEYFSVFKSISHNRQLLETGVGIHPDSTSKEDLILKAWDVFEPEYFGKIAEAVSSFNQANAYNSGSDKLEEVAKAAASGRVASLLIEANRDIVGEINESSGELNLWPEDDSKTANDVLDDIAEKVLMNGGEVLVIPHTKMPSSSGLAATFRY